MSNATLTSLAILKVNWDEGRDFVDILVPFVAEHLRLAGSPAVSLPGVQEGLSKQFGLHIPQNTVRTVLSRAAKHGYVKREQGIYRTNLDQLNGLQFQKVEQDALRMHTSLIDKLIEFSSSHVHEDIDTETAEGLLLRYLSEFDISILSAVLQGSVIPLVQLPLIRIQYLVGAFVNYVSQHDPAAFEALETVVKGHMLANFVFFQEPGNVARRFRGTTVFLDTPFLMRVLGYNGDSLRAPCLEMIELLNEVGGRLACFEHTAQEVRGILGSFADRIERGTTAEAFGRAVGSLDYLLAAGYSGSDVRLAAVTLEKSLRNLHVTVQPKPPYEHAFVIDEMKLEAALEHHVGYHDNTIARVRDVDSLSAIVRLRRGDQPYSIEDCKAVFVTTNVGLVRAAGEFFRPMSLPDTVPLAATDARLTNLVWLKKPMKAPDLPRKVIMARAFAATQPSTALWQKYLTEIQTLKDKGSISADDFILLRHSLEAKQALMELTAGGDVDAFTEGTLTEVLAKARENVSVEIRLQYEAQAVAGKSEHDTLMQAKAQIETELQGQLRLLQAQVELRAQKEQRRSKKVEALAARAAATIVRGVGILAAAGLVVGMITTTWGFPSPTQAWIRYLLAFLQFSALAVGLLNIFFGRTLVGLAHLVEAKLASFATAKLKRWLDL